MLDKDDRPLRHLEMEVKPGVSVFTWDLLLEEELALAAEKEKLEDADKKGDGEKDEKKGKKKKKQDEEADDEEQAGPKEGELAKKPWSEAVRLGWRLYVTPGTYSVRIALGDNEADTELKIKAGRPRPPRMKKKEKIRGEKDEEEGRGRGR